MITKPINYFLLLGLQLFSVTVFSQKVPGATGSKVSQEDAQEALNFHNKVRKDVGTSPLEWSAGLARYAQAWADHLAKDGNCKMQHRPHDGK